MPSTRSDGPKLSSLSVDSAPLVPDRVFWVPHWHQYSKAITVHDISAHMTGHWQGAVNKEYRELAKAVYDKYSASGQPPPIYVAQAKSTMRHHYALQDAQGRELVDWDHGWNSMRDVHLTYPPHVLEKTPHWHGHPVDVVKANKTFTRDRVFTVDSVMYAVEMDNTWRSNQFTIYKVLGGEKKPVGRYAQKWAGALWVGGCLVLDSSDIDEVLGVLATLILLKQNKQRAAERNNHGGGGGGGGG
jgi:hypothetical protein